MSDDWVTFDERHYLQKFTIPHCVRFSLETVPVEQGVQEAVPACFVIEFSGHSVQIVSGSSRYVPALHLTGEYFAF